MEGPNGETARRAVGPHPAHRRAGYFGRRRRDLVFGPSHDACRTLCGDLLRYELVQVSNRPARRRSAVNTLTGSIRVAAVCLLMVILAGVAPAQAQALRGNAIVTIKNGDLTVELRERAAWTIGRILYRDAELGTATGAYGVVISVPAVGGWIGSAHSEGGIERIEEIALTVDGEPTALTDGAVYECQRAELIKRSMLDKVRLDATLTFENERIIEHHVLTVAEDVVVSRVYAFMHCVTNATTQWIACTYDGQEEGGEFTVGADQASNPAPLQWHTGWEWTAAYDPTAGAGLLLRYLAMPQQTAPSAEEHLSAEALAKEKAERAVEVQTGYWDRERYHKLYTQLVVGDVLREGTVLDCECAVTCFEAAPDAWQERAREVAAELIAE